MGALTVMRYLQDYGCARVQAVGLVDQSPRIVTDASWRLGLFGGCSHEMLQGIIASARTDLAELMAREVEAASGDWLRRHPAARAALEALLRRWLGHFDARPLLDLAESLATADFRALLPTLDRLGRPRRPQCALRRRPARALLSSRHPPLQRHGLRPLGAFAPCRRAGAICPRAAALPRRPRLTRLHARTRRSRPMRQARFTTDIGRGWALTRGGVEAKMNL
jgi:hypothetical protein